MLGFREELLDRFRREKSEGLEALRRGDRAAARRKFLEASDALFRLARHSEGALKESRVASARKLLESADALEQPAEEAQAEGHETDFRIRERPSVRFDDIGGLSEVKELFRLKIVYPFQHRDSARRFGVPLGGGVLLFGPPGTGKTLLARAVAGEIEADFFSVKPSEILSKWVGEAEKNIEALFAAARSSPVSVVFIDELDALAPRRSESRSPVMSRLVPQILAELEGFEQDDSSALLFLGATNDPWSIDPAVLRPGRFDEKVYVGLPDRSAIRRILELNLDDKPLAGDVDLDEAASLLAGFTGADIRNICRRAASAAFMDEIRSGETRQIDRRLLLEHIRGAVPSVTPETLSRYEEYAREVCGPMPPRGKGPPAGPAEEAGRVPS